MLSATPPMGVKDAIASHLPEAHDGSWERLLGGRTNTAWSLRLLSGQEYVAKLYRPCEANPLFPNDPQAETCLLRHMQGSGLAPRLICQIATPDGDMVLYELIPGDRWGHDTVAVAHMIHRLHRIAAPEGLRRTADGSKDILAQTLCILGQCEKTQHLRDLPSSKHVPASNAKSLVHGDIVPGNLICNASGVHLIDWQCPAIGDPCEDVAIFLSPAMQSLYRGVSLSDAEREQFLTAYADADMVARYHALAPFYHHRMAAYCQWQIERGNQDYAAAQDLEVEAFHKSLTP